MTKWTLLIFYREYCAVHVHSIPGYETKELCEEAGRAVVAAFGRRGQSDESPIKTVAVPQP